MTAQDLYNYLQYLKEEGHDLKNISVNYREDFDSDVHVCTFVGEDLYDESVGRTLESIVLLSDTSEV